MAAKLKKVLAAAAILAAAAAAGCGLFLLHAEAALQEADCVVRIAFRGLENMFHWPYEYYALDGGTAVRIPCFMMKELDPDPRSTGNWGSTDICFWYTELIRSDSPDSFASGGWLESTLGPEWRIRCSSRSSSSRDPGEEELAFLCRTVEALHAGDPDGLEWADRSSTCTTGFLTIRRGNITYLEDDGRLLLPLKDGSFLKLMDCPEGGVYDFWLFLD